MMDYISDYPSGNSSLKRVFDLYAEETISDEQVERVLAPVLRMIKNGIFDRPHRSFWLAKPFALVASVAVIVALAQGKTVRGISFMDIPDAGLPLAAAPAENRVTLEVRGANGVELTLVNVDSLKIYGTKVIADNGTCIFRNVPEGTYRIMAESIDAGTWIVAHGNAELVSGGDCENLWKGVDVQVCLTQ